MVMKNKVCLRSGDATIIKAFKIGNKKYYEVKCAVCGSSFELRHDHLKNGVGCSKCNTVGVTRPELLNYFNDKDKIKVRDLKINSKQKFEAICPRCGNSKVTSIVNLNNNGFSCDYCSDSISFGERFMKSVLEYVDVENVFQLSKKHKEWCDKYRYDFYISSLNMIIEVHGMQHYRDCSWSKVIDIKENDKMKEQLAKESEIEYYVVLDCRYSDLDYIKNSILNSKLNELFDLSVVDWNACAKNASKSYLYEFCDYWNNTSKSLKDIATHYGVSEQLVRKYLKIGRNNNMCDYNEKRQKVHKGINKKKCMCIDTGKIYESINEASVSTGISVKSISNCCNGWSKTAGKMKWKLC